MANHRISAPLFDFFFSCGRDLACFHLQVLPRLFPAAGWSEAFTEDGETYYVNDYDQTTIWERPTGTPTRRVVTGSGGKEKKKPKARPRGEQREQPLPPGEHEVNAFSFPVNALFSSILFRVPPNN